MNGLKKQAGNSSEEDREERMQLRLKECAGQMQRSLFHAPTRMAAASVKHAPFQNTPEKRTHTPCESETKHPPMSSQVSNTEICMGIKLVTKTQLVRNLA